MSVNIPQVPEGVFDPGNLYNDVYGDLPPLSWSDPDFHSRLKWIASQVSCKITAWYSSLNLSPGAPPLRTATMFRAEVSEGLGFDFDVRSVVQVPELVVYTLLKLRDPSMTPVLRPYPGYLALNPPTEDPVGAPWPDHPWSGRRMFHANPESTYEAGGEFERPEGRYRKVRFVVRPGSGPFGIGGEWADAWEMVYSRQ